MKNNLIPIRITAGWRVHWNNIVEGANNSDQDLFLATYKESPFFIDIGFYYGDEPGFMALYAKDWENEDSIVREIKSTNLVEVITEVEDWMINYYHQNAIS